MTVEERKTMSEDDQTWVRRAMDGDSKAFGNLVDKYMPRTYGLALRMLADPSDAEDITQEAFLKAYKGLKGFRGESTFFTWLCRIVIHLCQDLKRKKRFRSRFIHIFPGNNHEEPSRSIESSVPDLRWSSNPAVVAEQAELAHLVQKILSTLPVRQKTVFVLKHFQGLKIKEIAEILGISEGTAKSHLARAVVALRSGIHRHQGTERRRSP
jgi:RNA polymerase sigma-70 factor (ECF subfamily)